MDSCDAFSTSSDVRSLSSIDSITNASTHPITRPPTSPISMIVFFFGATGETGTSARSTTVMLAADMPALMVASFRLVCKVS